MHAAESPLASFLQGWDYLVCGRLCFSRCSIHFLGDADMIWLEFVRGTGMYVPTCVCMNPEHPLFDRPILSPENERDYNNQ